MDELEPGVSSTLRQETNSLSIRVVDLFRNVARRMQHATNSPKIDYPLKVDGWQWEGVSNIWWENICGEDGWLTDTRRLPGSGWLVDWVLDVSGSTGWIVKGVS